MMTYEEAGTLVLADRRALDYRDGATTSDVELLEAVRRDVSLDHVIGSTDPDDELGVAYRVYLAHHQRPAYEELIALVKLLASEGILEVTPEQDVWIARVQRGDFD